MNHLANLFPFNFAAHFFSHLIFFCISYHGVNVIMIIYMLCSSLNIGNSVSQASDT